MNILFVRMSQRFIRPEMDRYGRGKGTLGSLARRIPRRRRLPSLNRGWAPDLLRELIGRGHRATFARLDSRAFMAERLAGRELVSATVDGGLRAVFTSSASALRGDLEASDAILLREDRLPHEALFAGFDAADRPVVTILAADARLVWGWRPPTTRFTLLVNSAEEVEACGRLGVAAEVFLKPAAKLFYEVPRVAPPKVYDVVQVLHDTASPRKRFDLFLAGIERLRAIRSEPVSVAVVGDTRAHASAIDALDGGSAFVTALGRLDPQGVRRAFLGSRTSVVTSGLDANPRVIAESLACGVPVACASDLTGGRFQVTPETGELFAPEPQAMARTLASMLDGLERYRPRDHCVTIEQAADQIERLIAS